MTCRRRSWNLFRIFAVAYLLGVPILVYWCVNKRKGLFVLVSTYVSVCANSIVKLTACVYRP